MADFRKAVGSLRGGGLIQREGGYVNDPDDPGKETKFGISKRSYPALDIPNLTEEDARDVYLVDFWQPAGCDGMPQVVADAVFDFAVTSSVRRSVRVLQQAAGVPIDGVVGPNTLAAVAGAADLVAARFTLIRMAYYAELAVKQKKNQKYLAGWILRSVAVLGL
jgi:lysozyme family protein